MTVKQGCGCRPLLRVSLLAIVLFCGPARAGSDPPTGALAAYLDRAGRRDTVVAAVEEKLGKAVFELTGEDYSRFLAEMDLGREDDLWRWSHLTGIPIVAVDRGREYFRSNAHLLADREVAAGLSSEALRELTSSYDRKEGRLSIRRGGGEILAIREIGSSAVRALALAGQVRHNPGFAADRTVLEALDPHLVPLGEVPHLPEVREALGSLPWPVVRALRGKAIYLTTERGGACEAVWHCVSSDLSPEYAGMQPGVFVAAEEDGETADALVRCLGRVLRETVLESRYFGLYAYPLQFPGFQALKPERRRVFGRRRDRLPATEHGYFTRRARGNAQENFVEHFWAYVREREAFRARAAKEQAAGHPELLAKYRFLERLVEHTPTTMEPLAPRHIARVNAGRQRAILEEYLARQDRREVVVAELAREYGKPFLEFTEEDYARLMQRLDLNLDDDLWSWSHLTGIPIAALGKRSITFHRNTHLLADVEAANLLPYAVVTKIRSSYDEAEDRVCMTLPDGKPLEVRELPAGTVRRTAETAGVVHSRGFVEDRLCYEALEPHLVALEDLENREELSEGIRMLPLSIVKAHHGKALYPTVLSRTGWAVTWRVNSDRVVSYVGMVPGSFVEPRRDPRRSPLPPEQLVANGVESLRGSSADSLVHEVGHIIDHSVVGGRAGVRSFPDQFPEFQKLLPERNRVFGPGDSRGPRTDHGYVSRYARVNAQEDFAECFWAYLRDREGFHTRAREEESEGHPELLQKFRFMEKLVDHTPAVTERLSAEYLDRAVPAEAPAGAGAGADPDLALEEYLAQQAKKEGRNAEIEKSFGKPFPDFTEEDYARFLDGLDLDDDDDLWRWSHLTDIPILALRKSSNFFYVNLHLLEDGAQAERMGRVRPKAEFDPASGKLTLSTPEGETLPIRELPAGVIRATGRTGRYWYLEDFGDDRVVFEALGPYLVRLQDLEYRDAIGAFIRRLPLSVVQVFRGKGIFFTTVPGRSYAVAMPCSNTTYKIFVGLTTGVFVDPRRDGPDGTLSNFVHEFGHLVDYVVMKGGYGSHRNSNQFPAWRKAMPEKELVFGVGDDRVPQTPLGYISRYSRTNAQENFAEHFRAFILEKEKFGSQARKEQAEGHPELMEKFRFMEQLLTRTPTKLRRLSREFLEEETAWPEQSGRLARLYRARRLLGEESPASLSRLLDETRAAAFSEPAVRKRAAGAFPKALGKVLGDVSRVRDRSRADAALGLLLGVTLEVGLDPDSTGARPALTATLRGAGEDSVTGTLTFDTAPRGRFGAGARSPVEFEGAQTRELSWEPDTGKDDGPFVARATAELRRGKRRFTLSGETVCRPTIPVWWVVGPFENPGGATEDLKHPPEGGPLDLKATFPGPADRPLAWREVRRDPAAPAASEFVVDLDGLLGEGKNHAGYAVVWAHSGRETGAVLSLGSADGAVAWVNGKRVLSWLGGRRDYASGSNTAPISLKKGANEILLKITVTGNGWRFAARILDAEGRPLPGLRYGLPH